MLLESLAQAASNNHGLSLQPMQVQELLEAFTQMQTAGALLNHRLELATRVIEVVLVHDFDGRLVISAKLIEQADQGFWMRHDKDTGAITIGLGEPPEEVEYETPGMDMGMPEVSGTADNVRRIDRGIPSVSEDNDWPGVGIKEDRIEAHTYSDNDGTYSADRE